VKSSIKLPAFSIPRVHPTNAQELILPFFVILLSGSGAISFCLRPVSEADAEGLGTTILTTF
jgi:hypothetical protein